MNEGIMIGKVGKVKLKLLTWGDFDAAVAMLAMRAIFLEVESVAGIPRGGLPLAVAVSHAVDVPMVPLDLATTKTLIVDDIADSGLSLRKAGVDPKMAAVWIKRVGCSVPVWSVAVEGTQAWMIFPWENMHRAEADFRAYQKRMENEREVALE